MDNEKVYEKLIEVSEGLSSLMASYESGREQAKLAQERNEKDHKDIKDCISSKVSRMEVNSELEKKADRKEVSAWIWIQDNPRILILLVLLLASVIGSVEVRNHIGKLIMVSP